MTKKYILWDPRDNYRPRQDDDGVINSDGLLGRVTEDNVYLKVYANYPGEKTHSDLKAGQHIKGVVFNLSGEKGTYDVYRVE